MSFDYEISGTDIEQYCDAVRILPETFAFDRGGNLLIPGIDGEYETGDKDTGSVDFVLETFLPFATFYAAKMTIAKLLNQQSSTPYLQRTLPLTVPIDVEIPVRLIGMPSTGSGSNRFVVSWPLRALSPFWRNQVPRTAVNPITSITVAGDGHVGDAVFTFTGGTTPVLTNTTNGDKLTLTASPGATPVVVDVGNRTVKQSTSDWDANFQPSKQRWMRLEPGANAMTLTGAGSVAVTLYEKYR